MSWAAIASAVVGAGLSAGMAAATAPEYASPTKSSRKTVLASLKALPGQRQVEAAARLGQKVDYQADNWLTPKQARDQGFIDQDTFAKLRAKEKAMDEDGWFEGGPFGGGAGVNFVSDLIAPGSSMGYLAETPLRTSDGKIKINVGKRRADFTGYGEADIQGKLARDSAQTMLDLQGKYGEDFIREALKQQEMADPEGTAARALLADKINQQEAARKTRERPVAEALDASVMGDVKLGAGVDDDVRASIERTLARRGGTTLTGDTVAAGMEDGLAGEQRLRERLQRGMSYLGSGTSPQDAAFREEQQSMANMASFLAGRTPQSQFASLSGGGAGASPMPTMGGLPGVDPNLMQNAQNAGLQQYSQGVRAAANQVNPWFAGLSAAINGVNTAGAAGVKPFGRN